MTRTILDTCTNADGVFYKQLKDKKRKLNSNANKAKDAVLKDMAKDPEMFQAFTETVEAM